MNTSIPLMIHPALRRPVKACCCPAYEFPHRRGGGACPMGHRPVCSACGEPTNPVLEVASSDPSELWGVVALMITPARDASGCCDAPVFGIHAEWKDEK